MLPWHQLGDWLGNFWVHYYNAFVSDVQCWCHLHFFMCSLFIVAAFFFRVLNLLSPKWGAARHTAPKSPNKVLSQFALLLAAAQFLQILEKLTRVAGNCFDVLWVRTRRRQEPTLAHSASCVAGPDWMSSCAWSEYSKLASRLRLIKFARWNVVKRFFSLGSWQYTILLASTSRLAWDCPECGPALQRSCSPVRRWCYVYFFMCHVYILVTLFCISPRVLGRNSAYTSKSTLRLKQQVCQRSCVSGQKFFVNYPVQ